MRERSNRKYGRFILRFESLALRPRLHRNERFPLKMIPQDHLVRKTYNELPQEFLNPQVPHFFPQEQHNTNSQVRQGRTSTTLSIQGDGTLVITSLDHKNNSH